MRALLRGHTVAHLPRKPSYSCFAAARRLEASDSQLSEVAQQGQSCSTGGCWLEKPTSRAHIGLPSTLDYAARKEVRSLFTSILSAGKRLCSQFGGTSNPIMGLRHTRTPFSQQLNGFVSLQTHTRRFDPTFFVGPRVSARLKR